MCASLSLPRVCPAQTLFLQIEPRVFWASSSLSFSLSPSIFLFLFLYFCTFILSVSFFRECYDSPLCQCDPLLTFNPSSCVHFLSPSISLFVLYHVNPLSTSRFSPPHSLFFLSPLYTIPCVCTHTLLLDTRATGA